VRRLLLRVLLLPALVLLVLVLPDVATAGPGMRTASLAFRWPLAGIPVVDRGFEPPRTAWGAGHRGVDLRAPRGTPVLAAGPGRVAYAGLLAGRGVVVVAHPGGLRTTYEPVAAAVHVGATVARGDLLGVLDGGHASCRPGLACLHWGLLRGSTYLDPLSLLALGRARLLPLHPVVGAASAPAAAPVVTAPPAVVRPGTRAPGPLTRRGTPPMGRSPALPLTASALVGACVLLRRRGATGQSPRPRPRPFL
jgi:hypothetical protein